jgi:B3 DNA binding domain
MPFKLSDPTGRTWRVFIEKATDGTHFTSGWPKFAKDHTLKENEFLVFQYDGIEQFSVVIFDESMCEREIMTSEEVAKREPEVVSLSDSEESESSESDEGRKL